MSTNNDDKFSSVEEWYVELERFIHYLAGRNGGLAVEYDDIVGELMVELVKGVQAYPDLPHDQLKAVLKRMFDNRISELKYRYHITHRKHALFNISLDIEVSVNTNHNVLGKGVLHNSPDPDSVPLSEIITGGDDPAAIYASKERVLEVRNMLSSSAKRVFDSLIRGNNMLAMIIWLSSVRSSYVFGSRSVKIRPWHIADALGMDEKEVKIALRDIKKVYKEVYNG